MAKSNSSATNLKNIRSKIKKQDVNPVFHVQTKEEDNKILTKTFISSVLRTGKLQLCNKNLSTIPDKLWQIYERPAKSGLVSIDFDRCPDDDNEMWWNVKALTLLNLSNNVICDVSSKIETYLDLTTLLLHHNVLTNLPKEIGTLQNLTHFDVSYNELKELPKELFELTNLTKFNASHNKLEGIDVGLSDLVMLQSLDLSYNQLKEIPDGIGFLVRLETLNLSNNKLRELPPDIVGMRHLVRLDVTNNELTKLPDAMNELGKLDSIAAQNNKIKELPIVNGAINLKELFLAGNEISDISLNFCENFSSLLVLDLRDNKITVIPEEISNLSKLTRLDLTNNGVSEVPISLSSLQYLKSFQLQGNPIKSIRRDIIQSGSSRVLKILRDRKNEELEIKIPEIKFPDKYKMKRDRCLKLSNMKLEKEISNLENLILDAQEAEVYVLDLSFNKLSEFSSNFKELPALTEINVERNQIPILPEFFNVYTRLMYLNVAHNLLENLPHELEECPQMRELNISFNKFTEIPKTVYKLPKLQILIANDNKIKEIDIDGMQELKSLATLDLANNDIQCLPPNLGNMKQIRSLSVTGNAFRYPRHSVLEKGTEAIMAHLRDRIPSSDQQ